MHEDPGAQRDELLDVAIAEHARTAGAEQAAVLQTAKLGPADRQPPAVLQAADQQAANHAPADGHRAAFARVAALEAVDGDDGPVDPGAVGVHRHRDVVLEQLERRALRVIGNHAVLALPALAALPVRVGAHAQLLDLRRHRSPEAHTGRSCPLLRRASTNKTTAAASRTAPMTIMLGTVDPRRANTPEMRVFCYKAARISRVTARRAAHAATIAPKLGGIPAAIFGSIRPSSIQRGGHWCHPPQRS